MTYQKSNGLLFDEVAISENTVGKNAMGEFSSNGRCDSAGSTNDGKSSLLFDDAFMVDRLNSYFGIQQAAKADRMDCDCID